MKFKLNDKVKISYNYKIKIIIGPIINRPLKQWCYYNVIYDTINYNSISELYSISTYKELKKICKIKYIVEVKELRKKLTDDDIINDIDTIKGININYRKKGKYTDNIYKLFGFNKQKDYENYIKMIEKLIDERDMIKMSKVKKNINAICNSI